MTPPLMMGEVPRSRTAAGAAGLQRLLYRSHEALLAFDFDGTLAPIVADPERAYAHPGVVPALQRLAPRVGALAVVTGRPARVAVDLGGFSGVPGLEGLVVAGHYGAERWDAATGRLRAPDPHPGVAAARSALPGLLAEVSAPAGTAVEDKGRSVAVHVRQTADPGAALGLLRPPLAALARDVGLVLEPGRMVLELRTADTHKGVALRELVTETNARCVLFAGDDLGDLAAYDAVEELRAEGLPGVLVCAASTEETALADRADLIVDGPAGVVALLDALATHLHEEDLR